MRLLKLGRVSKRQQDDIVDYKYKCQQDDIGDTLTSYESLDDEQTTYRNQWICCFL